MPPHLWLIHDKKLPVKKRNRSPITYRPSGPSESSQAIGIAFFTRRTWPSEEAARHLSHEFRPVSWLAS
jgi:hypothetical protein